MGVVMTPLLGSCAADDVVGDAGREGCDIILGQPMTVTSATRATDGSKSSTQFEQDEIVWLWANKTNDTEYITAWQLTAQSGGSFTGTNKYWPSDGSSLDVYALHGNFENSPSISEGTTKWSNLSLTHTVETDQTSDENKRLSDLLYSHPLSAFAPNNTVQLIFDHLLAKITVKLDLTNSKGIDEGELANAEVTLTNIQPKATISNKSLTENSEKTNTTGTHTTITAGKITSSISSGDVIGSAIVPLQQFGGEKNDVSQNNVITITLASPDNRSFSYKPATNVVLSAGMEYTYTLTILGNKITGSLSVSPFSSEGDKPISFKDYFDYLADLKNRNYLGSDAEPHDLSYDYNGLMNTANCYVVTHPGYYKFPLVYGNAIKNGATNAIAYGEGTNSTTFVNHLGNKITNPYIYKNLNNNSVELEANSAELVWQDAENLISDIDLSIDKHYIQFEITKENIQQGNAVIAVKDGSDIMWSWHIWVTNKNVYETYTYGDYKFMPISLGQRETDQGTTCTFYQWGRKDPFKGATANGQAPDNMEAQSSYNSSITNPGKFIKGTNSSTYLHNWFSGNLKDLWNVGNSSTSSTTNTSQKTIYDPSPVGFKVPPPAAFYKEMLVRNSTNDFTEGYKGAVDGDFWRAFGYLGWDTGSSADVGAYGYFWSCGPVEYSSNRYGWGLGFESGSVNPQSYNVRSYGFPVRPVSEQ